ncbi:tRNA-binding protein [Caldalkalibacillus salinus]|uniref:tRNA-binding protein n=1 Tax=Caldalkalibacillus salinus TaxID=2803787 RepID=UPI001924EA8F|nr:tRNA-binding protein [Caldalkalibacillus salinus]
MAAFDDFMKLDIRVGEVVEVKDFPEARKPAYQLWVDFGDEIGMKQSSAQITDLYEREDLVGKQVIGIVNFPPRKIAHFSSEVLVLGVYAESGVVLLQPDQKVNKGDRIG